MDNVVLSCDLSDGPVSGEKALYRFLVTVVRGGHTVAFRRCKFLEEAQTIERVNADGSADNYEIHGFDVVHLWIGSTDGGAYVFSRWDGSNRLTYGACCAPGTVPRFLSQVGIKIDSTPTEYKIDTLEESAQNVFPSDKVVQWLDGNSISHEFADPFFAHPECFVQTGCRHAYDGIWSGLHRNRIQQRKAAALTV